MTAFRATSANVRRDIWDRGTCHEWGKRRPLMAAALTRVLGAPNTPASVYFWQEANTRQRTYLAGTLGLRYYTDGDGNQVAWDPKVWAHRDALLRGFGPGRITNRVVKLPTDQDRQIVMVWLRHRRTGLVVLHASTHWESASAPNDPARRTQQARMVRDVLDAYLPDYPVQMLGLDANCAPGSEPHRTMLAAGWVDPLLDGSLPVTNRELRSWHGWRPPQAGVRIDWILTRGMAPARYAHIIPTSAGCQSPTDHHLLTVGGTLPTGTTTL